MNPVCVCCRVLFNGAYLYSPYGGTRYGTIVLSSTDPYGFSHVGGDASKGAATYGEGNTFDQCGCHSSSSNQPTYHCHVPPSCLLKQLGDTGSSCTSGCRHSPQVGWAYDGFPVYGPRGPSGTMMQACTVSGGTYGTDICTDDCGGYYKDDSSIDNYLYRYYMMGTYNDGTQCTSPSCPSPTKIYHPNSPICFRGCCPAGSTCSGTQGLSIPACSGTHSDGYSSSYTASTISSSGHNATAGTDMASGLPINPSACQCSSLGCETSTCSSQGWATQSCGAGSASSWTNDCGTPSSSPPSPPSSGGSPSPPASSDDNTATTVGAVIGGIVGVAIIGVAVKMFCFSSGGSANMANAGNLAQPSDLKV